MANVNLGFTLIEILISLFLLSLILFGFNSFELYSLREARNSYYYSVAENQLNNMVERLQHPTHLNQKIEIWNKQNRQLLPHGHGQVDGQFPSYTVSIFWGSAESQPSCKKGRSDCISIPIQLA